MSKPCKKVAKYIQYQKSPSVYFNLLHNNYIVRMRTQSHVCENPIIILCEVYIDLVILVSHNAYHIHNSFH